MTLNRWGHVYVLIIHVGSLKEFGVIGFENGFKQKRLTFRRAGDKHVRGFREIAANGNG